MRWRWIALFAAGVVAGAGGAALGFATSGELPDSGFVIGVIVAAYAAGIVTVAAIRGPATAIVDWRTRLDRDRWRRWCEEERERRIEAERRLEELRARAGYRGRF